MFSATQSESIAIILSSPSGGGKTSISKQILAKHRNIKLSVSVTTRDPRPGEKEAIDYYYKNVNDFQKLKSTDALLESAEVYGNLYGTQKKYVSNILESGCNVLFNIDHSGAQQIKKKLTDQKVKVISIFILPPSIEIIKERLQSRGQDTNLTISKRLTVVNKTLSYASSYDYVVVNDNFEEAVAQVSKIIQTYE